MKHLPTSLLVALSTVALSAASLVGCGGGDDAACGAACGSSSTGGSGGSSAQGGSGQGDPKTCNVTGIPGEADGRCGCVRPENHEICPATGPAVDCNSSSAKDRNVEACGTFITLARDPSGNPSEISRTTSTDEYAGTGPVDLGCFQMSSWPKEAATKTVKMKGYARNFANGCDSKGSKIEVYKVKRGGADDGLPGDLVGKAVTVVDGPCNNDAACRLQVVEGKCKIGDERKERAFVYDGIPTETELIVKSLSADGMNGFTTLYDYVYVPNSVLKSDAEGEYWAHDVRVVVAGDYTVIPTTAIGRQITDGNGSVAGEIHDCGDVRVTGASVDISSKRAYRGYFTDNEASPLPDPSRDSLGTSTLGLYSTLDITPGPARVSAVGVVGGKVVTLGYADVRVFPDAITAVTFRGFRPFQAKVAAGKLAQRSGRGRRSPQAGPDAPRDPALDVAGELGRGRRRRGRDHVERGGERPPRQLPVEQRLERLERRLDDHAVTPHERDRSARVVSLGQRDRALPLHARERAAQLEQRPALLDDHRGPRGHERRGRERLEVGRIGPEGGRLRRGPERAIRGVDRGGVPERVVHLGGQRGDEPELAPRQLLGDEGVEAVGGAPEIDPRERAREHEALRELVEPKMPDEAREQRVLAPERGEQPEPVLPVVDGESLAPCPVGAGGRQALCLGRPRLGRGDERPRRGVERRPQHEGEPALHLCERRRRLQPLHRASTSRRSCSTTTSSGGMRSSHSNSVGKGPPARHAAR